MGDSYSTIDGEKTWPAFILIDHELRFLNPEWGYPNDGPFTLELLERDPRIALISGDDGRGTTNGSPCYRKFLAVSKVGDKRVVTAYLAYTYDGPVKVEAWNEKKKPLLRDVEMFHVDITPDRVHDRLIERHLRRLTTEGEVAVENLKELAQRTFFEMLWNVRNR